MTGHQDTRRRNAALFIGVSTALMLASSASATGFTTFDSGDDGWVGPTGFGGHTFIDDTFGNSAPSMRTQFDDFGITFHNDSNPGFIGDLTATERVDVTIDTYTTQLDFLGLSTPREFIVEFRDYDNPPQFYPYVSVWASLGVLNQDNPGWHTWTATIEDTGVADLPTGWGGTGAEDPVTFEPTLPDDRTFASVLAGVDEIAFTTFVPGYFFSNSMYDVAIDNIGLTQVPAPAGAALLAVAGLVTRRRRA
jgi:MYXO-CTERM domain-containing protein